ncbi:cell division protein FtsQ/DivIB [Desulfurispira natronophila]|uniref:Cell division protein FtsQ n=1 Tax=Desulfurispira natronophila TaxID=682562 RepID=A0A7W8DH28_9BACT|nr:FtsQ-type POTRA domain-containing protein [Desulfurispira natronophila]MBB5022141.1 cell division protein FtsQ [Desulfurispira natronophila]
MSSRFTVALTVATLVALLGFGYSAYQYYHSVTFIPLRAVLKESHYYADEEKITTLFTNYLGTSIVSVDIDEVAKDLGQLPWVKSVAVFRHFNGLVKLVFSEYQPGYTIKTQDNHRHYVSSDGFVVETVREATNQKLQYRGIELPEIEIARKGPLKNGEYIPQTFLLYSLAESMPEEIFEEFAIRIEKGGLVLVKNSMEVFIGEVKYPRKSRALQAITSEPRAFYLNYDVHIDENTIYINESLGN